MKEGREWERGKGRDMGEMIERALTRKTTRRNRPS